MNRLEKLKSSDAWDENFSLPLTRKLNNPWIYMAYADMLLRFSDAWLDRQRVRDHFVRCEVFGELGLFYRREDGSGGDTSHDEIMGAAYFDPWIAQRILGYLERRAWVFDVKRRETLTLGEYGDLWQGRFLFLAPYLRACANYDVSYLDQLIWSLSILIGGTFGRKKNDAGGRLKNWLMIERMRELPLCAPVCWLWTRVVGLSLRECLTIEPGEYPVFAELAPEGWGIPTCTIPE